MIKNILELFSGIRWQDILDIGLNSYILFRLYALFRGTHVLRVIIWLALLWFFSKSRRFPGIDRHQLGDSGYNGPWAP